MADRTLAITLRNDTGQILTLQPTQPQVFGLWVTPPPATVEAEASFLIAAFALVPGIQGAVVYQIGRAPDQAVTLSFEDTILGPEAFTATTSPATAFRCAVTSSTGGETATVLYTLADV